MNEFLGRHSIVTYVMAALMVGVFGFLELTSGAGKGESEAEKALEKARAFYEQNPAVDVSERYRGLLGNSLVAVVEKAHQQDKDAGTTPIFSERMMERTQKRFDTMADEAFEARRAEFPAWRWGVSIESTKPQSYFTHVLVHESLLALGVTLVFFLLAGIGMESAWGSLLFGAFCLVGTVAPAVIFRLSGDGGGIPFSGASGLVAALLGAYLIRSFGGGFAVPGILLLPVWAFVEYLFVREIWIENWHVAPLLTHALALTSGVAIALAVRAYGIEKKLVEWSDVPDEPARNPALDLAEREYELGNVAEALTLLKTAHGESTDDQEVAIAYWNMARESGQADEAASAILPIIRDRVRRGRGSEATVHWVELVSSGAEFQVEAALAIRIGEGLLDDGHPDDALDALRRAVDHPGGLSTALAHRVVNIARDLDPSLTQRAASIALEDNQLDPEVRVAFEALAAEVMATPADFTRPSASPPSVAPTTSSSIAGPPAKNTHEATRYPVESDIDLASTADLTDPEDYADLSLDAPADGAHAQPDLDEIDPNALSISSLAEEFSGDLGLSEDEGPSDLELTGAVDPSSIGSAAGTSPALFDRDGLGDDYLDNTHLEAGALSGDTLSQETEQTTQPVLPPLGAAPPPASSASQGSVPQSAPPQAVPTSPLASSNAPASPTETAVAPPSVALQPSTALPHSPIEGPPATQAPKALPREDDLDIDGPLDSFDIAGDLRPLKIVQGVPIGMKETVLEVEIDGRGASKIPFDRIEAVALAAVAGISSKPVLIIDLVLNWMGPSDEPMKLIRLHSNRFNPKRLAPSATSPVAALQQLVAHVIEQSGAMPLPNASAAEGRPFASYGDVASYEREVLGGEQ